MLATVAFVIVMAYSNAAREVFTQKGNHKCTKAHCTGSLQAVCGARDNARCQTSPLLLSIPSRGSVQHSPRTIELLTCFSQQREEGSLWPSVPPAWHQPPWSKLGCPLPAPVPGSGMQGTSAAQQGPWLADRTQLMHLTSCSMLGS